MIFHPFLRGFASSVTLLGIASAGGLPGPGSDPALRQAFLDPPASCRVLPITHSWGATDPAGCLRWLRERRAGGTVLDAGVTPGSENVGDEDWNNPTYLNDPLQFERLRQTIAGMHERGESVWLYDELGYPSASAGGHVLNGHPEYAVTVVGCRVLRPDAAGGCRVGPEQGATIVGCWALPETGGVADLDAAVDLGDRLATDGTLEWQAPSADWIVCVLERFQPDTWRRHNIPRRNVNIMDRDAIARFIRVTHDRYAEELGEQLHDVELFFTDEPQFGSAEPWVYGRPECVPMVQWCDQVPGAFLERKGYDLMRVLPALFLDIGPETARYRYDFYDVQSALVAENYFAQIEEWCHARGLASSGHMLLEESLLFHLMFTGSMMRNWAHMDLPGVDLLGAIPYHTMGGWNHGTVEVAEDFSCKMASSVAHLLGKQGVFTESFAVAGKDTTLRNVLGVTAWQFAAGVTHMSTYTIQNHLSAEDYALFSDFAGRLATLCRRGVPVADVAVLVPEPSVWAVYNPPDGGMFPRYCARNPAAVEIDRVFRDTCHALLEAQRDFECVSDDLLRLARIDGDGFRIGEHHFRALVLPEARMLLPETAVFVAGFLEAGGLVGFVGTLPCQSPEHGQDAAVGRQVRELMARFDAQVSYVPVTAGLGGLVRWLNERAAPVLAWNGPSGVRVLHRREPGREIVLCANPAAGPAAGQLSVPAGGRVSVWDPETGRVEEAGVVANGEPVAVSIPAESARFVVVARDE
jgi:hypothetical protein